jgi:hypothetical protein
VKRKGGQSKADFVRSQPRSMSAADVVKKAKAAGMDISVAYVYVIRSKSKTGKGGRRAARGAAPAGRAGSLERDFVNLALDLGFARAQQLLDAARNRVRQAVA